MILRQTADEEPVNSPSHQVATLKPIHTGSETSAEGTRCRFQGLQGKRLTLDFEQEIRVSGPVCVEYNDALFLGEVVRCSAQTNGVWQAEVSVEHILTGLQSLLRFRAQLLGEDRNPTPSPIATLPVCA